MKRYIKVLIQVLPWYLKTIFIDKFRLPEATVLPFKIGKYRFVKTLSLKGFPFGTGLYSDKTGKKVVIKIWNRRIRDIHYFNLIHQIEVMKTITDVLNRVSKQDNFGFSTPKYIDSKILNNKIILIMEYVDGKSMQSIVSASEQFRIYKKCLSFLKLISSELNNDEKKIITTKSVTDFVFLYPLILLTAIFMQPRLIYLLLKGAKTFLFGIFPLSKFKPDRIVHGDLHPDNIMITDNNKYSLIDLENIRLCYSEYEPITTISLKGNSPEFKDLVTKKYLNYKKFDPDKKKAVDLLIVNNSTHNLSGDRTIEGVKSYKEAFALAFN